MAEYTDDDVKRNAEPGRAVSHAFDCTHDPCRCDAWPEFVDDVTRLVEMMKATGWQANSPDTPLIIARYLIEQGVTLPPPPPDPAVVVADDLWEAAQSGDLHAAVRDLFTTDALKAAAAKVQEAEG